MRGKRYVGPRYLRRALPPLHDKDVKVLGVHGTGIEGLFMVELRVNGRSYRVHKSGLRDELDALKWLTGLQHKEKPHEVQQG